ncbi:MAG: hypothetical protein ACNA8W_19850 [Bradymonadaceae bacterium]
MSYDPCESRLDERIQAMLDLLDEGDVRYQTLRASVDFQSAWIELAEHVKEVEGSEAFRDWGFRSFNSYCTNELRLSRTLTTKMLEGYEWIEDQAPEYLPRKEAAGEDDAPRPRPVPDVDTVAVLAKAHREVKEERIPRKAYDDIKEAALRGERTVASLRKELKAAVPEHLREEPPPNPFRHLRRALSEVDKAMMQINTEDEADLLAQASSLRDAIFDLVSARDETDDD